MESLRKLFADRLPGQSDLCCYWFEKARAQIADKKCQNAGLLATNQNLSFLGSCKGGPFDIVEEVSMGNPSSSESAGSL